VGGGGDTGRHVVGGILTGGLAGDTGSGAGGGMGDTIGG